MRRSVLWDTTLLAGVLLIVSCQRQSFDKGAELVNAAGVSVEETSRLLRLGADVNRASPSTFGWTPLITAIYHRKADIVSLLLARGADVNLADNDGKTPLYWAIEVWPTNSSVVASLVQRGADPRLGTKYGANAFDEARKKANAVELLAILDRYVDHGRQ